MCTLSYALKKKKKLWPFVKKKTENSLFFHAAVKLILKKNIFNSESALYYQFIKRIWECGISFAAGSFTNGHNEWDVGQ